MVHSGVRAIYRARGTIRVQKGAYLAMGFATSVPNLSRKCMTCGSRAVVA